MTKVFNYASGKLKKHISSNGVFFPKDTNVVVFAHVDWDDNPFMRVYEDIVSIGNNTHFVDVIGSDIDSLIDME